MASYYNSMEVPGFLHYVRCGKNLAMVSDAVIENIRLVTCQDLDIEVSAERFQQGQKLVIVEGVLSGLSCEVVEAGNKNKLLVRVELLNRQLLINIPLETLSFA